MQPCQEDARPYEDAADRAPKADLCCQSMWELGGSQQEYDALDVINGAIKLKKISCHRSPQE
jgi:hypothetical protein